MAKIPKKLQTKIAKEILHIPTLEERKRDSLDFHEVSVWSIQEALQIAYEAGVACGSKPTKAPTVVKGFLNQGQL